MIAPVIVVFHEARQGALEAPRATVLLKLDDVLHRPVVAFDLALRHGVIGPRSRWEMSMAGEAFCIAARPRRSGQHP